MRYVLSVVGGVACTVPPPFYGLERIIQIGVGKWPYFERFLKRDLVSEQQLDEGRTQREQSAAGRGAEAR